MDIRVVPGGDTQRGEAQRGIQGKGDWSRHNGEPTGKGIQAWDFGASQERAWWWGQDKVLFAIYVVWNLFRKQAWFLGHISGSGWKEMRRLCGIYWLGRLRDVGTYEGLAPSMWAFPAWFWRMSGTCAIYVPERQLDVEEKMWVQLRAKNCTKYVFFRDIHGANYLFEMELRHLSPAFCLWHRWRKSRNWAIYFETGVVHCLGTGFETMKYARFCSGYFYPWPIQVNSRKSE